MSIDSPLAPPALVDVAIVGAGASGLAAARRLAAAPVSVIVLEGRGRIGGRAHTISHEGRGLDLGCGWLHSADENVLARLAGTEGFEIDRTPPPWDRQAFNHEISPAEQAQFRAAFGAFERRVAEAAETGDEAPASTLLEPGGRWNPRIDAISGALNGARFREVSILDYDAYRDTEVNWRVVEGYGRLIEHLGQTAPVATNCAVTRIDRTGATLALETSRGRIEARTVIVTAPTAILSQERLRFEPALPDVAEAAAQLPLGLASKLHMTVEGAEDFPKDSQLWGRADTADTGGYHLRPFGRPMIEGYFGADLARGLEAEGEAAFFDFAREELVGLLGSGMRKRLAAVATSMWGADPWACGAYSHAAPGCVTARERLGAGVENRIFLAGEATSRTFYGTAHGAWMEGQRAARQALSTLGLDRPAFDRDQTA